MATETKELTIRQKAQRYDEALKKARKLYLPSDSALLEEIFPELQESDDEVRKELMEYFRWNVKQILNNFDNKDVLAWLEKQNSNADNANKEYWRGYREGKQEILDKYAELERQGEKDINDKVEPKFKAGDWIVNNTNKDVVFLIKGIISGYCTLEDIKGNIVSPCLPPCESDFHLWTIQDAKDGDILEFGDHGRLVVGIVSHVNKTTGKVDVNCLLEYNNFKVGNYYNLDTIKPHPATREQRKLLFQKMEEAGYKFDFEKKS